MSINVTVTGNPVSIKRGKMVTFDPYSEKKEFEKRRLMRLEQVRQQSKELAENVRNKVKKEKRKQMGELEKEGKEKLKNWQNRKLLELQNQYRNALDEIGQLKNEKQAKDRGKAAATKLQIQKNEENYRKAMPIQQKQIVRDIENTRASVISSINKQKNYVKSKCKKKKPSANIDITIPSESELSDNVTLPNQLSDIPEEQSDSSEEELCECSESSQEHTSSDICPEDKYNSTNVNESHNNNADEEKDLSPLMHTQTKFKPYHQVLAEHHDKIELFKHKTSELPLDTRISDRIKQRKLTALEPDFCDFDNNIVTQVNIDKRKKHQAVIPESKYNKIDKIPEKDPLELSSDECMCSKLSKNCPCKYKLVENVDKKHSNTGGASSSIIKHTSQNSSEMIKTTEIPTKPAVKLKEVGKSGLFIANGTEQQKVHYYDFPNRFEKDVASNSHVEKVTADSIEVLPNTVSEVEWQKKIKQRDKEAQIRGRNALEKEKIQRSYEEMMKKLPILQRKENIAQIGTDKPEYHMSEQRLQERENQKQARLENVYLREIPDIKPKLVTLPSKKPNILNSEEPFHILEGDDSRVLHLGSWDESSKPKTMFSTEEVQEIIRAFTLQNPEDRRAKLKHLLKSLKMQKEQLLDEIKLLPKDDSINALISDLNSFKESKREHKNVKQKRYKKRDILESEESYDRTESDNKCHTKVLREKQKKSDFKQRRHGSGVLVLQNMSTQTTPVAKSKSTTSTSTSTLNVNTDVPVQHVSKEVFNICNKKHTPCDCNKENTESSEELCKIFIKLHDDQGPKVEVLKSTRAEKEDKAEVIEKVDKIQSEIKSKSPKEDKKSSPKTLIKISPKIHKEVQDPIKKPVVTKSVATETEKRIRAKSNITIPPKKVDHEIDGSTKQRPQLRNESWKDHLSKNSMSTSSTSYMSPPDFSRPNITASTEISQQSFYNLRKKPQQRNVRRSPTLENQHSAAVPQNLNNNDLQLINYIKKLLSMSKVSIDELGVSSSDVQTPSQSIIETESNNPLAALHNIVRYINFKALDAAKKSSVSPDESHPPPNSLYSSSDGSGTVKDHTGNISKKDISVGINQATGGITSQYADITDSCTRRIANLASMIDKLREEKYQMLQKSPVESCTCTDKDSLSGKHTPTSDKNGSTRYFEFPPSGEKSKETNSSVSTDEEELHRRLIDIDMSLAEKLKRFRQTDDGKSKESSDRSDKSGSQPVLTVNNNNEEANQTEHDLTSRLRKLLAESYKSEISDLPVLPQPSVPSTTNNEAPFVPLLLDIPKLPILEQQPDDQPLVHSVGGFGRKCPPPSKGLITAKRFNGNISLLPHELSTIAEADSQLSTRLSPNTSKMLTSPIKDVMCDLNLATEIESLKDDTSKKSHISQGTQSKNTKVDSNNTNKASSHTGSDKNSLDSKSFKTLDNSDTNRSLTCNDLTCSSLSSSTSLKKSSSSSDMETIEAMLRSIGMDWAIPTLHKTQEALALTSSSSSSNVCLNKNDSSKSSCSEVSLKQFLKKQMLKKISSSSLKCDSSPVSFLQEMSEISAINPNNSSAEKTKRRTSTPVLSSKSTSNSKDDQPLFLGTSDISSVRNTSGDNTNSRNCQERHTFHTLDGDYSVTKSLI
ncbi:hypothetical protein GWI33_021451 [Rhynchophorus ferrugineus]|uniref:Uncharacterized protein n=1 Tax=Rhynchophorus ferrugineus TaxID=354439 RepID=A0A834IVY8_RHYFE|nr:hypothetical protein GWI33_021451 [Rhynchophorus ferrugineus]